MTQETKDNIQVGGFLIFMAIFLCFISYLIGRNHQDYEVRESIIELDGYDVECLEDSIGYKKRGTDDFLLYRDYYSTGKIQDCFCQEESRKVVKEIPYKKGEIKNISRGYIACFSLDNKCFEGGETKIEYYTEDGITTSTTTEEFSRCYIKEKIKK